MYIMILAERYFYFFYGTSELESLHWLGMDFMSKWLGGLLRANLKRIACVRDSDDDSASGSCDESIDQNGQECDYDTRIAI